MDNIVRGVDWKRIRNTEVLQKLRLLSTLQHAPAAVLQKWPHRKLFNSVVSHRKIPSSFRLSINIYCLNVCFSLTCK